MERRKFIKSSAIAAPALTLTANKMYRPDIQSSDSELIEIRTYEVKFGSNYKTLTNYLSNSLKPAMRRSGATKFLVLSEVGNSDPKKIWAFISYSNADSYVKCQNLWNDSQFQKDAAEYNSTPVDKTIFNRYTSSLLSSFEGMKQMADPIDGASIFELRTYEGYSEDAVRRKIKMFNDEEIVLFHEVGLHPVFFGDMIAGPHRPALVYMLNFKDMTAHGEAWTKFINHPDWNTMKVKPIYANTVSNIRKVFLQPL